MSSAPEIADSMSPPSALAACATALGDTGWARTVRREPDCTSTVHSPSSVDVSATVIGAGGFALPRGLEVAADFVIAVVAAADFAAGFAVVGNGSGGFVGARLRRGRSRTTSSSSGSVGGTGGSASGRSGSGSLRRLGGFVIVNSLGENDNSSFDPVGRTWMKSPSGGSFSASTFADLPACTPTAADVNHTIGRPPSASSARSASSWSVVSGSGVDMTSIVPAPADKAHSERSTRVRHVSERALLGCTRFGSPGILG